MATTKKPTEKTATVKRMAKERVEDEGSNKVIKNTTTKTTTTVGAPKKLNNKSAKSAETAEKSKPKMKRSQKENKSDTIVAKKAKLDSSAPGIVRQNSLQTSAQTALNSTVASLSAGRIISLGSGFKIPKRPRFASFCNSFNFDNFKKKYLYKVAMRITRRRQQ